MLFTNPNIIQNFNDVVIGGVEITGKEISFLQFEEKVRQRILKMVVDEVAQSMSLGNSNKDAVNEVAELVYSYLYVDDKNFPLDEEQIVDEIMNSAQFKNWIAEARANFLNLHEGVNNEETPVAAGGEKAEMKENYDAADENDFYDLMHALSQAYSQ